MVRIQQIATTKNADYSTDEQEIAWLILSRFYALSHDRRICDLASEMVRDSAVPDAVRLSAYSALLYVTGRECEGETPVSLLVFPDDINWDLVTQYGN